MKSFAKRHLIDFSGKETIKTNCHKLMTVMGKFSKAHKALSTSGNELEKDPSVRDIVDHARASWDGTKKVITVIAACNTLQVLKGPHKPKQQISWQRKIRFCRNPLLLSSNHFGRTSVELETMLLPLERVPKARQDLRVSLRGSNGARVLLILDVVNYIQRVLANC